MIERWNKAPGHITIDVMRDISGTWICSGSATPVSRELDAWLSANYPNTTPDDPDAGPVLHIEFESTGYNDPGRITGRPENCYPPEGEDEREIVRVFVEGSEPTLMLPESLFVAVDYTWGKFIDDAEIEKAHCG